MRRFVVGYLPVYALVALAVGLATMLLVNNVGDSGKYVAYATFDDAGGILKNYTVKVGNVAAGSIEEITVDDNDDVRVRMELDDGVGPIGAGASARVRPVNLLGEKYIDLDVGDTERPLPSGSTIPKSRTGVPTELDDVLNTLDPDTRTGLRLLINEAGVAMAGRGANFNAVLADLPPALDEARRVVSEIARENERLGRLVTSGDRVIASMTARRDDLGELVDSAGRALDTVADRRAELGRTLRAAPPAIGRLTSTLGRLRTAADRLTPASRDLRRTAAPLLQTLERTPAFVDDAAKTLAAAEDVAPVLGRLGRRSTPALQRLRPTLDRVAQFSADADPLLDALDQGRGLTELFTFFGGWAGVIDNRDSLGQVFRLRLTVDESLVTSAIKRYARKMGVEAPLTRTPKRRAPRERPRPAAPAPRPAPVERKRLPELPVKLPKVAEDLTEKALDELPAEVERAVEGLLGGLRGPGTRDADPPSRSDMSKLLDYLLRP